MNPADDTPRWYNNSDRRTPPQADIVELMARLDERLKNRERHDVEVIAKLTEVTTEQTAAREERHTMRAEQKEMREEQKTMREEMQPLTSVLNTGRVLKWFVMGLLGLVAALAAVSSGVKEHLSFLLRVSALAVLMAGAAMAHNAPSGWTYPAWCCGAGDCAELPANAVRATAAGWVVTLRPGSNPAIPAGAAPYTLTVPYAHPELRESPDGKFHLCLYPTPQHARCFFAPAGGV